VAGRTLGVAPLGVYTFAWNLATMPIEKISTLVGRVTPAFFSVVQDQDAALRRYLRSLTEALAFVTFPATLGLALTAGEFVNFVLGEKWVGVIAPLQLLAIFASFRSITILLPVVLTALRETRFVMWNTLFAAVLLPATFYVGSQWGTVGIAWGWIIAYPVTAVLLYRRAFRRLGMSVREYLRAVRPALNGSLAMAGLVLFLKWILPGSVPLSLRLVLEVVLGAITYGIVVFTFHRDRVRLFWGLFQQKRGPSGLPD
jgi:PST family polysaccharide transporter